MKYCKILFCRVHSGPYSGVFTRGYYPANNFCVFCATFIPVPRTYAKVLLRFPYPYPESTTYRTEHNLEMLYTYHMIVCVLWHVKRRRNFLTHHESNTHNILNDSLKRMWHRPSSSVVYPLLNEHVQPSQCLRRRCSYAVVFSCPHSSACGPTGPSPGQHREKPGRQQRWCNT